MTYFVIIGDLVGSRKMADREVQGITRHPQALVDIMVELSDALLPAALAWAWG